MLDSGATHLFESKPLVHKGDTYRPDKVNNCPQDGLDVDKGFIDICSKLSDQGDVISESLDYSLICEELERGSQEFVFLFVTEAIRFPAPKDVWVSLRLRGVTVAIE